MSNNKSASGRLNTVQFYRLNSSTEAVFKADKNRVARPEEFRQGSDEEDAAWTEMETVKATGIKNLDDPRFANRNVALYRLDRLLGGDLIPRTEFALLRFGSKSAKGTIMHKAAGVSAGDLGDSNLVLDASEKTGDKKNAVVLKDSNFQRLLSRLQLLDTLAMQVDRHSGNYFVEYDEHGNIIGLKGIDNDASFGEETNIHKGHRTLPAVSKFVDKEMAERILAIRPEDLAAVMSDLLSPPEIAALIARLVKLQEHLTSATLLEPDEWDDMTAAALEKEGNSYFNAYKWEYDQIQQFKKQQQRRGM